MCDACDDQLETMRSFFKRSPWDSGKDYGVAVGQAYRYAEVLLEEVERLRAENAAALDTLREIHIEATNTLPYRSYAKIASLAALALDRAAANRKAV